MKWRKLGRIFDPAQHGLPGGCIGFAQAPQALVFSDFVRIYFSTRTLDGSSGKYLSHVVFADMSKDLGRVLRVAEKPVIALGDLGCFDEHGIFPMNVVRHDEAIYGYTCGWSRRVSVSVETAIGLAISRDEGLTFERIGAGPVLGASLHEPCLVGDAFVRIVDGVFHMWYIFGTGWKRSTPETPPDRVYKIGHAVSGDGVRWRKEEGRQIVPDRLGPDECQALPSVISIDGCSHMLFCYREAFDFRTNAARAYRIGHARSADGTTWTRDDDALRLEGSPGEWDSDMQCYPHVFQCEGRVYLLYNGNAFGRFGFGAAILER
ncbi:MAG TPA: hypothetical protein VFC24_00345 [Casimicrobiaceae bacterium]|nr:hypothetical protein [Casimicrobiaceae bacterium]